MYKKLLLATAGVYAAYLTASVLSERLYSGYTYPTENGEQSDLFIYPSLVFTMACLICTLYGVAKSFYINQPSSPIPLKEQLQLGFLYTANALTTNYSLLYITYPTQSVGRNLRYLSVILVGAFFSKIPKDESTAKNVAIGKHKIVIGSILTVGIIAFNAMKFMNDTPDTKDTSEAWKGYVLLIISVICDSLFADHQAYSKVKFSPSSNHLYTCANFFGFVFSLLFSLVSGTFVPSLDFVSNHKFVLQDILLMCGLQLFGQNCIYFIVANFKQHIFPLIATTRKLLTVLISIYLYSHPINIYQWLAVFLVFGSMIYEINQQANENKKISAQETPNGKQKKKDN